MNQSPRSIQTESARVHSRGFVLAACMMATFMAAVESTIVATAMPTIVADLGGFAFFFWVFSGYLLAQAVTIPIYGRLADLYGRRRVFFVGASVFLLGSTLAGLSQDMLMLIGFRILQGIGAGAVQPIAYTIVGDIYTPAERARVQGMLSGVFGVSAVVGPALGAFLVEHADWRLVFWINLPIGAAAISMIAAFLHEEHQPRRHRIDYPGAVLLALGIGALVIATGQAQDLSGPTFMGLIAAGLIGLMGLAAWERRAPEPMLPSVLWRSRVIAPGSLGGFAIGAVMMSVTAFLPTYVQAAMGRSAMIAGLVLGVMSVVWAIASVIAGRLMVRTSYRRTAVIGALALLGGSALLVLLTPARGPIWAGAGAFVIGLGLGFCNTTWVVSVQASASYAVRGVATSSIMFMRMLGQAVGAAVCGAVLNLGIQHYAPHAGDAVNRLLDLAQRHVMPAGERSRLVHAVATSLHDVYLVAAATAVGALLLGFCLPAGLSPRNHKPEE